MTLTTYTFFCDECRAVVQLTPTNSNARLNVECAGQEPLGAALDQPVKGSHAPQRMRQIGAKPL